MDAGLPPDIRWGAGGNASGRFDFDGGAAGGRSPSDSAFAMSKFMVRE